MKLYGRLTDAGLVIETCALNPITCFAPQLAEEFIELPDGAEAGDTITENGAVLKAQPPEEPPVVEAAKSRCVSKAEFYGALSREQRIALKAAAEGDAAVADFLEMLEINGAFDLDNSEDVALLETLKGSVISQDTFDVIIQLR